MLDPEYIREHSDEIKKATLAKQKESSLVDNFLSIDEKRKELLLKVEGLRAKKNSAAKDKNVEDGRKVKEELSLLEPELSKIQEEWKEALWQIPNTFSKDTKEGRDESENVVVRKWGKPREFNFYPKDHIALGESLNLIDMEKAGQVSGSRFTYLKGPLVSLQFALIQFALSVLIDLGALQKIADEAGIKDIQMTPFIPVIPPVMIRPEVFDKMARLNPREERYHIPSDDLFLVGSAEHTLGPLHMDETIDEKKLPVRYVGYSTSFRREAGSYGKDTRGILRLHHFDKLEIESFTTPETGENEQNFIVAIQEHMMRSLEIPYQVVSICSGDMGGPDYRQFDIDSWIPSQGKYRETHTSDYMTDYQARRLNTKFRRKDANHFVHMNDATVFAMGRTLIAIMENFQEEDGSINIPQVLQKWVGKEKIEKEK